MAFTKPTDSGTDYPTAVSRAIDIIEGPGRRNFVRNGDFQIAQRGTSFSGITTAQYTLDGWYFAGSAGTNTISQQSFSVGQTSVPGNPRKYLRVDRTVAAGASNEVIRHPIEFPEHLSGKAVTVGFWAKVGSGTKALAVDIISGGVTSAVDTSDTAFTASTTWTYFEFQITVPAMTAATSDAYLAPRIIETSGFSTFTLDVADFQLELGSEGTYFERLTFDEQRTWCRRFYVNSFAHGTAPAQNVGVALCEQMHTATKAGATAQYGPFVPFPVPLRKVPTITLYNTSAANAQIRDLDVPGDCSSSSTSSTNERGFWPTLTGHASTAVGNRLVYNWAATAEL